MNTNIPWIFHIFISVPLEYLNDSYFRNPFRIDSFGNAASQTFEIERINENSAVDKATLIFRNR